MQKNAFDKFVRDEFDFIVFSDAPTEIVHADIANVCAKNNVKCIRIPQKIHEEPFYLSLNMPELYSNHTTPSNVRHVHAVQYSLDKYGFDHDGPVVLIDNEMFFVRPIDILQFMQSCDIATYMKESANERGQTIGYCCPALTFLNMSTMPEKRTINFNCGWVNGCSADSGGFTHYYIKAHPDLRMKYIESLYGGQIYCPDRFFPQNNKINNISVEQKLKYWNSKGFNKKEINFLLQNPDTIQFFMCGDNCWLFHYRGGTNYEKLPANYHELKKKLINAYLDDILS